MMSKVFPRPNNLKEEQMMSPYEYLGNKRIVFCYGEIASFPYRVDNFGATWLIDTMLALDAESHDPIKLIIDSPGGMISSGFSIYDTIKTLNSPVYTVGRSCQSMAVIVLAAGEPGHRYLYKNSRVMLHLPIGNIGGDIEDIKLRTKEMDKLKDKLVDTLIECGAGKAKKKILDDIDREYWMSPQEAINYGIVDRIIEKPGIII